MRTNPKTAKSHVYAEERLAGGYGPHGAVQSDEARLRRLVMACLLWEDIAYADGQSVVDGLKALVPKVPVETVAALAVEARFEQKLRHVPLLLVREMARHPTHKGRVAKTLARIIHRPDELAEFLAIYWKDNGGRKTLSAQVKKGLARAMAEFDEYQLAKWDRQNREVKLRDVLFLCHAKPKDATSRYTKSERAGERAEAGTPPKLLEPGEQLFRRLVDRQLATPDTWEVGVSAAKTPAQKRAVWQRLILENKLGSSAFLKNLRNMRQVSVPRAVISQAFAQVRPAMLLPIDFLRARTYAPDWSRQLEALMLICAAQWPRLPGWTIFVVDVSGSMATPLSAKTRFTRYDAAAAMAVLAAELCEHIVVYATAGDDPQRVHATAKIPPYRGFALADAIRAQAGRLGGGGIFTRQCLEFIRQKEYEDPDRIIVFSDSQDCDLPDRRQPRPFGRHNYIVDVSNHSHGVNYQGVWTAEIAGWSEHFLRFIAEVEHAA
jgi:hypothetical protein